MKNGSLSGEYAKMSKICVSHLTALLPAFYTVMMTPLRHLQSSKFRNTLLDTWSVGDDVMSCDHHMTIMCQEPAPRILALSENCIIERDPSTYIVVTIRPLSEVQCICIVLYRDVVSLM